MTLKVGQIIDGYKIVSEIGRGGNGIVFKAKSLENEQIVAIKVPFPERVKKDPTLVSNFLRETSAISRLEHPCIAAYYKVGTDRFEDSDGVFVLPYLIMEYVEGEPCSCLEKKSIRQIVTLMQKVAEAVSYAHGKGVIHRDLKPTNIFVDAKYNPKILDFGLALLMDQVTTASGIFEGSPSFAAPEQFKGEVCDERADIWMLGSILFSLLTGQPPFVPPQSEGMTQMQQVFAIQERILKHPTPKVSKLNPAVDEYLERICMKALTKDIKLRYQTAEDFATDLKNWGKVNRDLWFEKSKKDIRLGNISPQFIKSKMIQKSYNTLIHALSFASATTQVKEHLVHLLQLQGMDDIVLLEMALPDDFNADLWKHYSEVINICSQHYFEYVLPIQKVVIGQAEGEDIPRQVLTVYNQPKGQSLQFQIGKVSLSVALELIHKIADIYRFFQLQNLSPALPEPPEIFLEPLEILAGGWPFRAMKQENAQKELAQFLYYILTGFHIAQEMPDFSKIPAKIRDAMMRTFAPNSSIKSVQAFIDAIDKNLEAYRIIESGVLDRTFEFPSGEYWIPQVLRIEKTGHMKLQENTILHFEAQAGIICYGQITALGEWNEQKESGTIYFIPVNNKDGWGGIHIFSNNVNTVNTFKGCNFENSHGSLEDSNNIIGGAIHCEGGNLLLKYSCFKNNYSNSIGAAITVNGTQQTEVTVQNVLFIENKTKHCGGAVYIDAPVNATFTSCYFEDNRSKEEGGSIYFRGLSSPESQSTLLLQECNFTGNKSQISGGVLVAMQHASVTITECTFDANIADDSGGALFLMGKQDACTNVELQNCKFINNRSQIRGGAIALKRYSVLNGSHCKFDGNSSDRDSGGAIALDGKGGKNTTYCSLHDTVFVENRCRVDGGAINANINTELLFEDCRFDSNAAEDNSGGAVVLLGENEENFSLARFLQCTFYRNRCKMDGGAVNANIYSKTYFEECRFKNNSAEDSAGALEIVGEEGEHFSEAIFKNVAFMNNRCKGTGGAINALDATNLGFDNCQFDNNRAEEAGALYVRGTEARASEILFRNCIFSENKSKQAAGAISFNIFCRSKLEACRFKRNQAEGKQGGAISILGKKGTNSTEATLNDVSFVENLANMDGGAMYIGDYSLLIMDKCRFDKNKSESSGGAMSLQGHEANYPTKITLRNSKFTGNYAKFDGGAMIASYHTRIVVSDCRLENNHADNSCGAIGIDGKTDTDASKAKFKRVIFYENSCKNDGGAMTAASHSQVVFEECRFEGNFSEGACGALGIFGQDKKNLSDATFRKVTFLGNHSSIDGGAMVIGRFSRSKFDKCIFEQNYVDEKTGGALLILGKNDTFTTIADFQEVIFRKNTSAVDGGAINANIFSQASFRNCLFEENIARKKNGGAIVLLGKDGVCTTNALFKQVTFRKNQCNISGGAINANDYTRSHFINCVFEENIAHTRNGGAILVLGEDGKYPSDARFIGVEFKNNHAQGSGGAVNANVYTITSFEECLFAQNSCEERGGGILIHGYRRLPNKAQIKNCHFVGNMAGKMGADVAMNAVKGVTKESLIQDNKIEIEISEPDFLAEEAEETKSLLRKRTESTEDDEYEFMETHKMDLHQIRESYNSNPNS